MASKKQSKAKGVQRKLPTKSLPKAAVTSVPALEDIRTRIDSIDDQLLALLSERARVAQEVGRSKRSQGDLTRADLYRPEREAQVLRRMLAANKGPVTDAELTRLYREIMSACRAQQDVMKVAFLGPEGTFTQQAVFKHFGHAVQGAVMPSIPDVFQEVQAGQADFGIVPIENSTGGVVEFSIDMFLDTPLKICGEVELRIQQNLMTHCAQLSQIKRVYSHQQSLSQCRHWLRRHLPGIEQVAVSSNAEAARLVGKEKTAAAIAGELAAEMYGLPILARGIEDQPDNTTRFLVIGRKIPAPSGHDRTTLMVSAGDTDSPGTLHRLLEPLARHSISMTRIESRPSRRKKWDYVFFIDVEGHIDSEPLASALEQLKQHASLFKVLGSYPIATP